MLSKEFTVTMAVQWFHGSQVQSFNFSCPSDRTPNMGDFENVIQENFGVSVRLKEYRVDSVIFNTVEVSRDKPLSFSVLRVVQVPVGN